VTNSISDPQIHSPHHRGIFSFNRFHYGEGKIADTWQSKDGAYQEHDRFLSTETGPVLGRHRIIIRWNGKD
jgi:hypothetical protein